MKNRDNSNPITPIRTTMAGDNKPIGLVVACICGPNRSNRVRVISKVMLGSFGIFFYEESCSGASEKIFFLRRVTLGEKNFAMLVMSSNLGVTSTCIRLGEHKHFT